MKKTVLANWHQRVENFQFSTQDFYQRVQETLAARAYPQISFTAVQHHEGGPFTPKRDYLRIRRHDLDFELCAAPFGVDFFISWWLLEKPGCFGCLFFLGPLGALLTPRKSYYQEDTEVIFREAVHDAVVAVLGEILGDRSAATLAKLPAPKVAKSALG